MPHKVLVGLEVRHGVKNDQLHEALRKSIHEGARFDSSLVSQVGAVVDASDGPSLHQRASAMIRSLMVASGLSDHIVKNPEGSRNLVATKILEELELPVPVLAADTGDRVASLAGKYGNFTIEHLVELFTSEDTDAREQFASDIPLHLCFATPTKRAVSKLFDHFKRMQDMGAYYLMPEPYRDRGGKDSWVALGSDQSVRDRLFAGDMLYMLDGPEQRQAQREAQSMADQGYPTEDAYLSVCRALHWRTEELRFAGIEPLNLTKVVGITHYPPDLFFFPINVSFPGDTHRQVYHGWRRFPQAMLASIFVGVVFGVPVGLMLARLF